MSTRRLPNKILHKILHDSDRKTLLACERVSKEMQSMITRAGTSSPWRSACRRDFGDLDTNVHAVGLEKPFFKHVYVRLAYERKQGDIRKRHAMERMPCDAFFLSLDRIANSAQKFFMRADSMRIDREKDRAMADLDALYRPALQAPLCESEKIDLLKDSQEH